MIMLRKLITFLFFLAVFIMAFMTFADAQVIGSPQNDISETQITESQTSTQVGQDVTFTVTLTNNAPYYKFISAICFESTDGNFGCSSGMNLSVGQSFTISNSGRWTSGGAKNIWVTWSQDDTNYYRPLNSKPLQVLIKG